MMVKSVFAVCMVMALAPCKAQNINANAAIVPVQIESCKFSFRDFVRGSIIEPRVENEFKSAAYAAKIHVNGSEKSFGFDITCHAKFHNENEVSTRFGGRFNKNEKKWIPDFGDASENDILELEKVTKTFSLDSRNGHGFYTIQDDLDGEPSRRVRHISYCLFHETNAVCGYGQVKRLVDAKSDMLPYALRILRSVEFTDTPAATDKTTNP
jgi:hypothetical protein